MKIFTSSPIQRISVFFLAICCLFQNIDAQLINTKQGQLILQLKPEFGWQKTQQNPFFRRSESIVDNVQKIKQLGNHWNIWLVGFDFTKIKTSELIYELKKIPEVLTIQENHLIKTRNIPDDEYFNTQWYHLNSQSSQTDFDSDLAWDIATGGLTPSGDTIVLCIIDEGMDINHEDLRPNLWINSKEIDGNGIDDDHDGYVDDRYGWNTYQANDTFDIGNHGTPVAGLAAARGNNTLGIAGMCWNTKIMFVEGGGDEANAIESYSYPFSLRRQYNQSQGKKGAFVVATNASWGSNYGQPSDAPLWCAIYDSLGAEGIINVASTANLNINVDVDGDLPTACGSEFLISVTSMNDQNLREPLAAYGKKSIDLGAYGESVFSTFINNTYRTFSGTSAASPQVAGAVALIYSVPCNNLATLSHANPPEAAREVKRIILNSVRPNSDLLNKTVSGGVLNLYQAVLATTPLTPFEITDHSISLQWDSIVIYPIAFRYRIKNNLNWIDTTIYSGNQLKISGLETCTEYELQYKNLCERSTNNYSPSHIYKTSGCCDAPSEFRIIKNTAYQIDFNYYDADNSQLIALLRPAGTSDWDTFFIESNHGFFSLYNLNVCSQYELVAYTNCNNHPTPLSVPFLFNTGGCDNCTEKDYCKRFKPSSDFEWLDAITIDNNAFKSGNDLGYGNYVGSNHSWTFEKNKSYNVSFQAGYLNDTSRLVVGAWIDFNQDGNFDTNENFAIPTTVFTSSKSYNFTIPANAKSGLTRMRVCLSYAEFSQATPLPCFQSIDFGEYEDYCVTITNAICADIQSVQISKARPNQVELSLTDPSSNSFIYSYRKLFDATWTFGVASSKIIDLNPLDSCSRYEINLQSVCNDSKSDITNYKFNTPGTGCLNSTKDEIDNALFVYPNPFHDELFISNENHKGLQSIWIYSLDGKLILNKSLNTDSSSIHLEFHSASGYYFIKLKLRNGNYRFFRMIHQ